MSFAIDRRPTIITIPYGAVYGSNIWGLDPTWLTTPATRIANTTTQANAYGIARRILHLPQGTYDPSVAPFNNYPAGITLQAAVSTWLGTFTPAAGEEWELYSGGLMPMNPLGDLFVTGPTNAPASTGADATFITTQAAPFRARGFRGFWVDALARNSTYVSGTFTSTMQAAGWTRVGTEAFAAVPLSNPLQLDATALTRTRYAALLSYCDLFNPGRTWTVNPLTTECHVWLDSATDAATVQSFISRGFIPGIVQGVTSTAACENIASWAQHRFKPWTQ